MTEQKQGGAPDSFSGNAVRLLPGGGKAGEETVARHGYWIQGGADPAPWLRRSFELKQPVREARLFLCGLGWHELYVNGRKADDRVLAPTVSQFDRHVAYIAYDVSALLRPGRNAVAVLLGNGWYNCRTEEVWNFAHAPWLDVPKLICELVCDGETVLFSSSDWKCAPGPITFNQLRNGEFYDARLEIPGVTEAEFDDSGWNHAVCCNPPGGLLTEDSAAPCRICERIEGVPSVPRSNGATYDFGRNLTGWCEIEVTAPAGSRIDLCYSERVLDNGEITRENISMFIHSGECQLDRYTCKGEGVEIWHPRFVYHGFRYCRVSFDNPEVRIRRVTAHFVHSDFARRGEISCSDAVVNALQQMTVRSYLCNYTGIPTDCPHREKNGWTGDAQIAMETGLWNFDCAASAVNFTRLLADCQRPSGQLPGIAPCAGWGYNWGSGPAWDVYLFEAPWRIRLFTGDDGPFLEFLPEMKKYLAYCAGMMHDGLVDFGLGDWGEIDRFHPTPSELTSSCYIHYAAKLVSRFAPEYADFAEMIRRAVNRRYYRGDGVYANGERTALACALYFDVAEPSEREKTARRLAEAVRDRNFTTGFGILGTKFILRSLVRYGFADEAFELLRNTEFPGFGYWVKCGRTTLPENWNSGSSLNHIMFGDISAFLYECIAGIRPLPETPGFRHFELRPAFPAGLGSIEARHVSKYGAIRSAWRRGEDGVIRCEFEIPEGSSADILLPGIRQKALTGHRTFEIPPTA